MEECIFCQIIKGEVKSWKVFENESVYAFLDTHPISEYHTLVIPKGHYENIFDIPEEELIKIMSVVKKIVTLYETELGINNVQIFNNSGAEAEQEIFHFHFHVVPRKDNQDITWTTHPELQDEFDQLLDEVL